MSRLLVALTGASGAPYAVGLLKLLQERGLPVDLIVSSAARQVLPLETGLQAEDLTAWVEKVFAEDDFTAPPASGSANYQAMVIIPCTMGTLSAVAQGAARNLIQRAADVMLKERRPLILVVRETPLNLIHLNNMLKAARAGAVIYPAMPAFYHRPKTLEDLVYDFVTRLADFLGIEVSGLKRWKGLPETSLGQ